MHYFIRPLGSHGAAIYSFFSIVPKGVCKADEPPYLHFGNNSLTRQALVHIQEIHLGAMMF